MPFDDILLANPGEAIGPYKSALVAIGHKYPDVVVLGADLGNSTEIDGFREVFPDRFFNVGAAEQNEVDIAVGLSFEGLVPFVHSFGVFISRRAYEQVCVQVAMHDSNVKLVGVIPGLTSRLGPTHQAIEDLSLMATLPNMTVIDPADATEIEGAVEEMAAFSGPVYSRMMRREVPRLFDPARYRFRIGQAVPLKSGHDVLVATTGLMLQTSIDAVKDLETKGISCALVHVPTIKPFPAQTLLDLASGVRAVVTVENHLITGGLGTAIAHLLAERLPRPLRRVGLNDEFAVPGTPEYLFERYGLTSAGVVTAVEDVLNRSREAPWKVS